MMKFVDYACAWFLLGCGIVSIVLIELHRSPLPFLDTPFLWILVAMFNLLRLRNGYAVPLLRVFCVSANVVILIAEVVRWRMYGSWALIAGIPVLCETFFSLERQTP